MAVQGLEELDPNLSVLEVNHAESLKNQTASKQVVDTYTNFTPPKLPAPKQNSKPTLPAPKKGQTSAKKSDASFKPFAHFGMPFQTDSGSEMGASPHPQVIMAQTVEDCSATMALGRDLTASTIVNGDHQKQATLGEEFDEKLSESIRKGKENVTLSYIQNAIKMLMISTGIVGGVMLQLAGASTGNGAAIFYGTEMAIGGLLTFGSFCLDQIGYGDKTWTSLMSIGGALTSLHGGFMGFPLLADKLPNHATMVYNSVMTLLTGYSSYKRMGNEAEIKLIEGEIQTLQKERKDLSDTIKKHYGALNIKDFQLLFKTGSDFVHQTNQATSRILQGALQG